MSQSVFGPAHCFALLSGSVLIAASTLVAGQTAGLALVGATIYAAPDSAPIRDGVAILRNGKIEVVGTKSAIPLPSGMPVLDLAGQTLVAGFWNSHVHFLEKEWNVADTASADSLAAPMREMLTRWGFTTVFDTGSPLAHTLALKRRIESGALNGPRIFTTGDILFPPGAPQARFQLGTPEQASAASKQLLDGGADALKVYAQAWWDPMLKLSPQVLDAVVAEARRRKLQVFAHPSNRDGLHNAVAAGVDVLMHTTPQIGPWGEAIVAKMKAANIALVPTLTLWRFELMKDKAPPQAIEQFQGRAVAQLREYASAGGPILFGTDVGYMTDFSTLEEFQKMAQAGMDARAILASLTTVPAARRGLAASSGRVAAGYDADLVVLGSDPAQSTNAFADVRYTIRAGRIIHQAGPR